MAQSVARRVGCAPPECSLVYAGQAAFTCSRRLGAAVRSPFRSSERWVGPKARPHPTSTSESDGYSQSVDVPRSAHSSFSSRHGDAPEEPSRSSTTASRSPRREPSTCAASPIRTIGSSRSGTWLTQPRFDLRRACRADSWADRLIPRTGDDENVGFRLIGRGLQTVIATLRRRRRRPDFASSHHQATKGVDQFGALCRALLLRHRSRWATDPPVRSSNGALDKFEVGATLPRMLADSGPSEWGIRRLLVHLGAGRRTRSLSHLAMVPTDSSTDLDSLKPCSRPRQGRQFGGPSSYAFESSHPRGTSCCVGPARPAGPVLHAS